MKHAFIIAALALSACSHAGRQPEAPVLNVPVTVQGDSYCKIAKKIRWSVNDTRETIDQARREAGKIDRICSKVSPQPSASSLQRGLSP